MKVTSSRNVAAGDANYFLKLPGLRLRYQRFRRERARHSRRLKLSESHISWQCPELLLFHFLAHNRASVPQKFFAAGQGSCTAAAAPPQAHVRAETSFPKPVQKS